MLGKNFSRQYFEIFSFFLSVLKKRLCHFIGLPRYEANYVKYKSLFPGKNKNYFKMSSAEIIIWENKIYFKMSSAEIFTQHAKLSNDHW